MQCNGGAMVLQRYQRRKPNGKKKRSVLQGYNYFGNNVGVLDQSFFAYKS